MPTPQLDKLLQDFDDEYGCKDESGVFHCDGLKFDANDFTLEEFHEVIKQAYNLGITTTIERVERSVLPANNRILEERMATLKQELLNNKGK